MATLTPGHIREGHALELSIGAGRLVARAYDALRIGDTITVERLTTEAAALYDTAAELYDSILNREWEARLMRDCAEQTRNEELTLED